MPIQNDKSCDFDVMKESIKTTSRVDVLEDRFDRHLRETRDQVKEVLAGIADLKKSLSDYKLEQSEKYADLKSKVHFVNTIIAMVVSGVVSIVITKVKTLFS